MDDYDKLQLIPPVARLFAPRNTSLPLEQGRGIILVGLYPSEDFPAMLLIWDEGLENKGMCVTYRIQDLLRWVHANWQDFPVAEALTVQRDDLDEYWHVFSEGPVLVKITPMRWPGTKLCSLASFLNMLGERGARAFVLAAETAENYS